MTTLSTKTFTGNEVAGLMALGPIVFAGVLLLTVPFALLRAFVLGRLWAWFVTPVFAVGAPSLAYLYGLTLFCGLLTYRSTKKGESEGFATLIVSSVVGSLLTWGCGAIVHFYFT